MLRSLSAVRASPHALKSLGRRHIATVDIPIVEFRNAKLYNDYPKSEHDKPILSIDDFSVGAHPQENARLNTAVISLAAATSQVRTNFLKALQGEFICVPPTARTWPYLSSDLYKSANGGANGLPSQKIGYVGFANDRAGGAGQGTQGAYLSARYESRVEANDWSLRDYLTGGMGFNMTEEERATSEQLGKGELFKRTVQDLRLDALLGLPVGNLSNGQTRRARIAKALLAEPELLLLDEPFVGLDPLNHQRLAQVLEDLIHQRSLRVVLSLQMNEPIPYWVNHLVEVNPKGGVTRSGNAWLSRYLGLSRLPTRRTKPRSNKFQSDYRAERAANIEKRLAQENRWDTFTKPVVDNEQAEPVVEMDGVQVSYGTRCVLGNWRQSDKQTDGLHWTVKRGDRWAIFGANGSGKTTIISLLTSDHPQAYSLPIKIFGESRLPEDGKPGISLFDIQSRIGHSSPEVQTHFPKSFTLHQVLESAWSEAFYSRPKMTYEDDKRVASALKWFRLELDPAVKGSTDVLDSLFATRRKLQIPTLPRDQTKWENADTDWADGLTFGRLSHQAQKVALFLRAVIKKPDIVVLDEAFSGMDEHCRTKCMLWLAHGQDKWLDWDVKLSSQSAIPTLTERRKIDTKDVHLGRITTWNTGLETRQALICVSHRPQELPFLVDKYVLLPEQNEGLSRDGASPASVKFGEIDRTESPEGWWDAMWRS